MRLNIRSATPGDSVQRLTQRRPSTGSLNTVLIGFRRFGKKLGVEDLSSCN